LTSSVAGKPSNFTVTTKDKENATLYISSTVITCSLTREETSITTDVVVEDKNKDGIYYCSYTVNVAGVYLLRIYCNSQLIREEVWKITVIAGDLTSKYCLAKGEGLIKADVGKEAQFTVITRDGYENRITIGGQLSLLTGKLKLRAEHAARRTSVVVGVESPVTPRTGVIEEDVTFTDNNDGTYTGSYTVTRSGKYSLSVKFGSDDIYESPWLVNVASASTSALTTIATGSGLKEAKAGQAAEFVVTTSDNYGNVVEDTDAQITAYLVLNNSNSTEQSKQIKCSIVTNHDGTYLANYTVTISGSYTLEILYNGSSIKDSPFTVNVSAGEANAARAVAKGEGLSSVTVGGTGSFIVKTFDEFRNIIISESLIIKSSLTVDGNAIEGTVVNNNDGSYNVSYSAPSKVGTYPLKVTCNGTDIKGSEFSVNVVAGSVSAVHSELSGKGKETAVVGEKAVFKVILKDEFSNLISVSDISTLQLVGYLHYGSEETSEDSEKIPVNFSLQTNTFSIDSQSYISGDYIVTKYGEYKLYVTVLATAVQGSPFTITAAPAAVDATLSKAEGEGLTKSITGIESQFYVIGYDKYGNKVPLSGAGASSTTYEISAILKSSSSEQITATRVENKGEDEGVIYLSYTLLKIGEYSLTIKLNGVAIQGSPFTVIASAGTVSITSCVATGEGITTGKAGITSKFIVTLYDNSGNVVTDSSSYVNGKRPELSLQFSGIDGVNDISRSISDGENGIYNVEYTPVLSGVYSLHVLLDGENIKDSPFSLNILPGNISALHCEAEGEGLKSAVANEYSFFKVITKDNHGNNINEGGKNIIVKGTTSGSIEFEGSSKDNKDGTYLIEYTAKQKGDYKLNVSIDNENIKNSPFDLIVSAGAVSTSATIAEGEGLTTATCGKSATFNVIVKDEAGNIVERSSLPSSIEEFLTVTLKGPQAVEVNMKDNNDGTFTVNYITTSTGNYSLVVLCAGGPIQGSPFTVTSLPSDLSPAHSVAFGDGLSKSIAGENVSFSVQLKDAFGNSLQATSEILSQIESFLVGPADSSEKFPVSVSVSDDGLLILSYSVTTSGSYLLHVLINSVAISGSPFSVVIDSSNYSPQHFTVSGIPSSGISGETLTFIITLLDQYGNTISTGNNNNNNIKLTGALTSSNDDNVVQVSFSDNGDGTVTGKFTPELAGTRSLVLQAGDDSTSLQGSPYSLEIAPGSIDPSQAEVEFIKSSNNTDENNNNGQVGEPLRFIIKVRDSYGNLISVSSSLLSEFSAKLVASGSEDSLGQITFVESEEDAYKGLVEGRINMTSIGIYELYIYISGKVVKGSPFTVQFNAGSFALSEHLKLEGLNSTFTAGEQFIIRFRLKDAFGNLLSSEAIKSITTEGWTVTVKLIGSEEEESKTFTIESEADFYKIIGLLTKAGNYELNISLGSYGVFPGGPFNFTLIAGSAANLQWIQEPQDSKAGVEQTVTLQAIDSYSNIIKGNDLHLPDCELELTSSNGSTNTVVVKNNNDGSYEAKLMSTNTGKHSVSASFIGSSSSVLSETSRDFNISAGAVDAGYCIAVGEGLESAVAGEEAFFLVQSRDAYGNEVTEGGAVVTATLKSASSEDSSSSSSTEIINGVVTDNGDGIYRVVYVVKSAVTHILEVSVDNQPVLKSPFTVRVSAGTISADTSSLASDVGRSGKPGQVHFKLQARDRFGNPKVLGGDDVAVYLTKPIRRPAIVLDNNDGTYTIKHPYGLEEGDYQVHVTLAGETLKAEDLPGIVHVEEAEPVDSDDLEFLSSALPDSSSDIISLLKTLAPEKRKKFIADLQKLRG
jgi:hypothetical protein